MNNLESNKVNIIREYKKIYDGCTVEQKIKILGNIQKYEVDMIRINTLLELEKIRNNNIIDMTVDGGGALVAQEENKIKIEFTNYKRDEKKAKKSR